jgi:hypothetical protein
LLSLHDGCVDEVACPFECAVEQSLVGFELMPSINGTAGSGDRKDEEDARERHPKPLPPSPGP